MRTSYEVDVESDSTYLTGDQPHFNDKQMLESPWLAMMGMKVPRKQRRPN